jgi:hypothetical protein
LPTVGDSNYSSIANAIDLLHMCANKYIIDTVNRDPIDCGEKQCRAWWPSSLVKRGVSHYGLAIYIKKYLKANEELWKLKYFTIHAKI